MAIDEVTMGDRRVFETVDRTMQNLLKQPDKPFGGVVVLFSGDWRQCLPVVQRGGEAEILARTLGDRVSSLKEKYIEENNK